MSRWLNSFLHIGGPVVMPKSGTFLTSIVALFIAIPRAKSWCIAWKMLMCFVGAAADDMMIDIIIAIPAANPAITGIDNEPPAML